MRVYLAGPYQHKEKITACAEQLRALRIEVTSSWLEEPHKPTTQMHELTHEEHLGYALRDVQDVFAADAMIFFNEPTKTIVRAGRHVEFGMVVALNYVAANSNILGGMRPIFVVGSDFENIFHHVPHVFHFDCWELALDAVCRYQFTMETT